MELLKAIGYWHEDGTSDNLPDPIQFVDSLWLPNERAKIIDYLNSGTPYCVYLGYSYCRFRCGLPDSDTGIADLNDGEWAWPEGLAHYVEKHNVVLPQAFVECIRRNNYRVPESARRRQEEDASPGLDCGFWREWCQRNAKKTPFSIWLEFELWVPEAHEQLDDNFCNMAVHLPDGRKFALNVWTFKYFESARKDCARENLNMGGRYLPGPDLFVERLDRELITQIVADLIGHNGLKDEWRAED